MSIGCGGIQVDQSGHALVNPKQIFLVCGRQQAPAPGQEITIDYGDKPNEQLLLSYGEPAVLLHAKWSLFLPALASPASCYCALFHALLWPAKPSFLPCLGLPCPARNRSDCAACWRSQPV